MIKNQNFVSQNKFAVLANNDSCKNNDISTPLTNTNDDLTKTHYTVQNTDPSVPPIYIKNIAF